MYLSRFIVAAVVLSVMAGPVFAGKKKTVCHNGQTISISKNALSAHKAHGDRIGACPTRPSVPVYKAVAMIRCLNNEDGDVVVSGLSISANKVVNPLGASGETSCANAVARMMNNGYSLEQVSTGLTDGETEYLFLGNSRSQ